MRVVSILVFLLLGCFHLPAQDKEVLNVKLTGIKASGKQINIAVYTPEDGFPGEDRASYHMKLVSVAGENLARFELPYGEYAIAVFVDENGNGRLDKNMLGFPKEQFGFSNNFRPRTGAPKFKNCSFGFSEKNREVVIRLRR